MELVEYAVNIETKRKNSELVKKKCSFISCVIMQIVAGVSFEHVNFSSVNKETMSKKAKYPRRF